MHMVRSGRDPNVIRLHLLGAVDARDAQGRPLVALLAQPRRLCLLAMLAIESMDGACTRERLMATFWPNHRPEQAAANLRQALAFLRRVLGDDAIVAHGRHALAVDHDRVACDAVAALRAGRAAAASAPVGELLAGVHPAEVGDEWDDWLQAQRLRLERAAAPQSPAAEALPADPEARTAYLHGRLYWSRRPRESAKALASLERAVALAPDFAPAHAAIADVYNTLGSWESGAMTPREAFPRAIGAAQRALAVDPCCAAAHTSLGYATAHYDWAWSLAQQQFERAVALDPTYAHAHHWHAHVLVAQRRFDDALAASRRALELQPLDVIINVHMAWHHWLARDADAAIEQAARTSYLDETDHWPPFFRGMACAMCGRAHDAVDALREACTLSKGNAVMRAGLGYAYAVAGDRKAARQLLREFDEAAAEQHRYAYEAAVIYAGLGELEHALDRLGDALGARSGWMPYLAVDPRLDPLRGDARYVAIERTLGLHSD
jgi:DNA-binding SARP family transcriptional activator/Flp pilus assembly protein TadD